MIVVTGGAGFIGSNILAGLEQAGYKDLVVVDYMGNDERWKNIAKRELADIVLPDQMEDFLEKNKSEISVIIHMGAISATTETNVDLIVRSNQQLTWKLWEYCRDNDIRFIYASSAATYGNGSNGFEDRDDLQYLNKLRPLNAYGWSKVFIDRKIAREKQLKHKTPSQYVGLKFFNVYGPNEYHKGDQKSIIAHMFPVIKANQEVKLFKSYDSKYKDGEQLRDFVWVGDIVKVILYMLENKHICGLYNVGSGCERSFYDLARAVWNTMGMEPKIGFKDMPVQLRNKYQYYTKANIDKLRAVGYTEPMTKLEDGIKEYIQKYLNTQDIYV